MRLAHGKHSTHMSFKIKWKEQGRPANVPNSLYPVLVLTLSSRPELFFLLPAHTVFPSFKVLVNGCFHQETIPVLQAKCTSLDFMSRFLLSPGIQPFGTCLGSLPCC